MLIIKVTIYVLGQLICFLIGFMLANESKNNSHQGHLGLGTARDRTTLLCYVWKVFCEQEESSTLISSNHHFQKFNCRSKLCSLIKNHLNRKNSRYLDTYTSGVSSLINSMNPGNDVDHYASDIDPSWKIAFLMKILQTVPNSKKLRILQNNLPYSPLHTPTDFFNNHFKTRTLKIDHNDDQKMSEVNVLKVDEGASKEGLANFDNNNNEIPAERERNFLSTSGNSSEYNEVRLVKTLQKNKLEGTNGTLDTNSEQTLVETEDEDTIKAKVLNEKGFQDSTTSFVNRTKITTKITNTETSDLLKNNWETTEDLSKFFRIENGDSKVHLKTVASNKDRSTAIATGKSGQSMEQSFVNKDGITQKYRPNHTSDLKSLNKSETVFYNISNVEGFSLHQSKENSTLFNQQTNPSLSFEINDSHLELKTLFYGLNTSIGLQMLSLPSENYSNLSDINVKEITNLPEELPSNSSPNLQTRILVSSNDYNYTGTNPTVVDSASNKSLSPVVDKLANSYVDISQSKLIQNKSLEQNDGRELNINLNPSKLKLRKEQNSSKIQESVFMNGQLNETRKVDNSKIVEPIAEDSLLNVQSSTESSTQPYIRLSFYDEMLASINPEFITQEMVNTDTSVEQFDSSGKGAQNMRRDDAQKTETYDAQITETYAAQNDETHDTLNIVTYDGQNTETHDAQSNRTDNVQNKRNDEQDYKIGDTAITYNKNGTTKTQNVNNLDADTANTSLEIPFNLSDDEQTDKSKNIMDLNLGQKSDNGHFYVTPISNIEKKSNNVPNIDISFTVHDNKGTERLKNSVSNKTMYFEMKHGLETVNISTNILPSLNTKQNISFAILEDGSSTKRVSPFKPDVLTNSFTADSLERSDSGDFYLNHKHSALDSSEMNKNFEQTHGIGIDHFSFSLTNATDTIQDRNTVVSFSADAVDDAVKISLRSDKRDLTTTPENGLMINLMNSSEIKLPNTMRKFNETRTDVIENGVNFEDNLKSSILVTEINSVELPATSTDNDNSVESSIASAYTTDLPPVEASPSEELSHIITISDRTTKIYRKFSNTQTEIRYPEKEVTSEQWLDKPGKYWTTQPRSLPDHPKTTSLPIETYYFSEDNQISYSPETDNSILSVKSTEDLHYDIPLNTKNEENSEMEETPELSFRTKSFKTTSRPLSTEPAPSGYLEHTSFPEATTELYDPTTDSPEMKFLNNLSATSEREATSEKFKDPSQRQPDEPSTVKENIFNEYTETPISFLTETLTKVPNTENTVNDYLLSTLENTKALETFTVDDGSFVEHDKIIPFTEIRAEIHANNPDIEDKVNFTISEISTASHPSKSTSIDGFGDGSTKESAISKQFTTKMPESKEVTDWKNTYFLSETVTPNLRSNWEAEVKELSSIESNFFTKLSESTAFPKSTVTFSTELFKSGIFLETVTQPFVDVTKIPQRELPNNLLSTSEREITLEESSNPWRDQTESLSTIGLNSYAEQTKPFGISSKTLTMPFIANKEDPKTDFRNEYLSSTSENRKSLKESTDYWKLSTVDVRSSTEGKSIPVPEVNSVHNENWVDDDFQKGFLTTPENSISESSSFSQEKELKISTTSQALDLNDKMHLLNNFETNESIGAFSSREFSTANALQDSLNATERQIYNPTSGASSFSYNELLSHESEDSTDTSEDHKNGGSLIGIDRDSSTKHAFSSDSTERQMNYSLSSTPSFNEILSNDNEDSADTLEEQKNDASLIRTERDVLKQTEMTLEVEQHSNDVSISNNEVIRTERDLSAFGEKNVALDLDAQKESTVLEEPLLPIPGKPDEVQLKDHEINIGDKVSLNLSAPLPLPKALNNINMTVIPVSETNVKNIDVNLNAAPELDLQPDLDLPGNSNTAVTGNAKIDKVGGVKVGGSDNANINIEGNASIDGITNTDIGIADKTNVGTAGNAHFDITSDSKTGSESNIEINIGDNSKTDFDSSSEVDSRTKSDIESISKIDAVENSDFEETNLFEDKDINDPKPNINKNTFSVSNVEITSAVVLPAASEGFNPPDTPNYKYNSSLLPPIPLSYTTKKISLTTNEDQPRESTISFDIADKPSTASLSKTTLVYVDRENTVPSAFSTPEMSSKTDVHKDISVSQWEQKSFESSSQYFQEFTNNQYQSTLATTESTIIPFHFTIDANYDEVVGSRKKKFEESLTKQLGIAMRLPLDCIQNLEVKKGSIEVNFDLVPNSDYGHLADEKALKAAADELKRMIDNGQLNVNDLDGNTLVVIPLDPPTTPPPANEMDHTTLILGVVIGAFILTVMMVAITAIIYKRKSSGDNRLSPIEEARSKMPSYREIPFQEALFMKGSVRNKLMLGKYCYNTGQWLGPGPEPKLFQAPESVIYRPPTDSEIRRTPRPPTAVRERLKYDWELDWDSMVSSR